VERIYAKVLIIDDHPSVRSVYKEAFEAAGYEVVEAADGQEGIDSYVRESPDLVITDIGMPIRDGHEVIDEIRKGDRDVKVIAVTGAGIQHLPVAHEMGADRVFQKPLRPRELIDAAKERFPDGAPPNHQTAPCRGGYNASNSGDRR
jgi:DNA-binding response OmpR family regulator